MLFLSYSALVVQFSNLGLRPYSVRAIAADRPRAMAVVGEMLAPGRPRVVAVALVASAYLHWIDPFLPDALIAVFAPQVVLNAIAMCFIDGLYGRERIREVAKSLARRGVVQVGSLAAVALDAGTAGVACATSSGPGTLGVACRFLVAGGPATARAASPSCAT
ncbi:MAG: hypothetical protein IPJ28_11145 [Betaproteobacteria bacterium]|nr:hypothetical protein [Betaproteobacteria bacterium]